MPTENLIIASGPVVVENNKVLLDISGTDSFWKFCGGKIQKNESLQKTAIRRAKEELGINVTIINSTPFLLHQSKKEGSSLTDIILVHFLAERQGEIVIGKDIHKWDWIPIENLGRENLAPNIIPTLKYFGFLK